MSDGIKRTDCQKFRHISAQNVLLAELLLAGDVAWHMDGVRLNAGKDAPWIKEPAELMAAELDWLSGVSRTETNLSIVISHDDDQRRAYIERGVLGDGFE